MRLLKKIFKRNSLPIQLCLKKEFSKYSIGEYTYGDPEIIRIGNPGSLTIGKFCSFARFTKIYLCNDHRIDWVTTYPFTELFKKASNIKGYPFSRGDTVIGNDVWVGLGAKILSGVTVGDGVVIGAETVVTKDIPPYAIVVGNPCKIVRYRFSEEHIAKLLSIKWWNWSIDKIENAFAFLLSDNIEQFLNMYSTEESI